MSFGKNSGSSSQQSSQTSNSTDTSTPNNLPALQQGWSAAEAALNGNDPNINAALQLLTNNANSASSAANSATTSALNYAAPGATTNNANQYLTPTASGANIGNNNPLFQNLVNQLSQSIQGSTDGGFAAAGRYGSGANANAFNTALTNEAGQLGYANYNQSVQNQLNAADQLSTNNNQSTNQALVALGLIPGTTGASTAAGTAAYGAASAPNTTYANILNLLGAGGGTTTGSGSATGQSSGTSSQTGFGINGSAGISGTGPNPGPASLLSILGFKGTHHMPSNAQAQSNLPAWYTPEDDDQPAASVAAPKQTQPGQDRESNLMTDLANSSAAPLVPYLRAFIHAPTQSPGVEQPASPAPNGNQPVPAWLTQQDAQEAQQSNSTGAPANGNQPLPSWYTPEPEQVTVTGQQPESAGQGLGDLAANVATGVGRVPGAIIGTPHVLMHTLDWLGAKLKNMTDGGNRTGADVDAQNPIDKVLPTSEGVDKHVFDTLGVKPYEPTSIIGKLLQAGVTGAGAGLIDPGALLGVMKAGTPLASVLEGAIPRMAKTAVASDAANATQQLYPNQRGLAAAAALIAHTGASGVGVATRTGGGIVGDATRQVLQPTNAGNIEAGRVLGKVDNTQPGLAAPTDADLGSATGDVRTATDDIGLGQQPWQAGAQLRAGLQQRSDELRTTRSQAGDAAYDTFRAQPSLPSAAVEPLMRSPGFRKAVSAANAAVLDEGGEPMTDYWDFDQAGDPVLKPNAAIPPDVLGRVKSWTAAAAANAPAGSAEARTAGILDKRVGDFLDSAYPATASFPGYAAVRQAYADAGKPLGDFASGPVAKTLDAEKQFGQSRYTLADERVPDVFLRSKATRADLNQLVAASGGDRATALSALQDHLAGVAQSAVKPDGTLDTAVFDRAIQPYKQAMGGVGMFFPELAGKFANAKAAQATLDNIQAQRSIADAVSNGVLRDGDGAVTGASFSKWLQANKAVLGKTQSPAALMRLQSMARVLQGTHPGELADALKSELLPAAVGTATFGLEGGVLATLLHRSAKTAFGSLDQKRQAAFSSAIEQAVTDPAYAQRLAAGAARQGQGVRPVRALVRAIVATPLAVNAGTPSGGQ